MVVKRVGAVSLAKIAGILYAVIGLLIGAVFSLIGMAGAAGALGQDGQSPAFFGMLFGVGAIIILPICYGLMGFVGTWIGASIFNLVAGWTGGVIVEVQQ